MKILIDFFPILLFFAAYKLHAWFGIGKEEAIYFATPVLMGATVLQMAIVYAVDKKLTAMHKVTLALILVFGGITLALHDKRFIMWKPTVLYAGMAIALAFSIWGMRKSFLKAMLGSQLAVFPAGDDLVAGCLQAGEGVPPPGSSTIVYLDAGPALDGVLARVAGLGGRLLKPKTALPPGMGYFAHIEDSEGNRVGLHAAA